VYNITLDDKPFLAYCDLCTNGYAWTVIQRRLNGIMSFYRDWATYVNGFGSLEGEFWMGNKHIAGLTATQRFILRVELSLGNGNDRWAEFDDFKIGDDRTNFTLLSIGAYTGNAGDSLDYHVGMKFSTLDSDNDLSSLNCALNTVSGGGWWFRSCHMSNLNGAYGSAITDRGVNWNTWTGNTVSAKTTLMMIRPYYYNISYTGN
jgi:hypothetical protein